MAGDIKWIKVITDIFEDEKIKLVKSMPEGRTLVLIWFQLLVQAGKTNATGWIYLNEGCAYSPAMLSTLFNESQQMVELALRLFSTKPFEMIEITEDGLIYIPNWEKHQNVESMDKIREKERLRKAKQREKQKLLMSRDSHGTSHGTSHESHATEIEKELELDIQEEEKEEPPQSAMDAYYFSFKKFSYTGHIQGYVMELTQRGFTDAFIREVFLEMGARGINPDANYMRKLAEDWITKGIYTRAEASRRRDADKLKLVPGQKKKDLEIEVQKVEIARNRWIAEGKNPDEFNAAAIS